MANSTPLRISQKSQDAIIQFEHQCCTLYNQQWGIRQYMQNIDLAYIREQDYTKENIRARTANMLGDPNRYQNITVPIIMPQVEAAVAYQSSVFLTGAPLFGWVAPPEQESSALQYQAIIEENSVRGGWVQQLMMFFRDSFKYNLAAVETTWGREVTAAIETDVTFAGGREGKPKEVIWQGNELKRWDLYNSFWDTRCLPTNIYKDGEFAGTTKLMSRIQLKKFINELPDKMVQNIIPAFESGVGYAPGNIGGVQSYYIPQLNPVSFYNHNTNYTMDWMAWAGVFPQAANGIQYRNSYEVTTLYARILPSDFNLIVPSSNTPQVWKFIIVNHNVIIYAERQTNAHGYIPVLFGQANEDGLGYQTKSLATNGIPFQALATTLANSAIAARRRSVGDRGIYDPSRISEVHINSDNPAAKIPLRPAGFGKPISEAYYSIPFRDDQSPLALQEMGTILQMANQVNGQNQAKQGQFVKGNKTLHEYDSVMSNANSRDQMTAMLFEAQVFTPLKAILEINTLQYQAGITIFSRTQQKEVTIDPIELRKAAATYTITDGLTPTDKAISGDDLTVALQVLGSSPQIGAGYNLSPLFSYLMKTRNADLTPFEKSAQQMAYEQALQTWQQVCAVIVKQQGESIDPSKFPPQPLPEQFGYVPTGNSVASQSGGSVNQSTLSNPNNQNAST